MSANNTTQVYAACSQLMMHPIFCLQITRFPGTRFMHDRKPKNIEVPGDMVSASNLNINDRCAVWRSDAVTGEFWHRTVGWFFEGMVIGGADVRFRPLARPDSVLLVIDARSSTLGWILASWVSKVQNV